MILRELLLLALCSAKPWVWTCDQSLASQCPVLRPQLVNMGWHVTEAGPLRILLWDFLVVLRWWLEFSATKIFLQSERMRLSTERSSPNRDIGPIPSLWVPEHGCVGATLCNFPLTPCFSRSSYFELYFGHFNWKTSPDWRKNSLLVICSVIDFAFITCLVSDNQKRLPRVWHAPPPTHSANLKLAHKISLLMWHLFNIL